MLRQALLSDNLPTRGAVSTFDYFDSRMLYQFANAFIDGLKLERFTSDLGLCLIALSKAGRIGEVLISRTSDRDHLDG